MIAPTSIQYSILYKSFSGHLEDLVLPDVLPKVNIIKTGVTRSNLRRGRGGREAGPGAGVPVRSGKLRLGTLAL